VSAQSSVFHRLCRLGPYRTQPPIWLRLAVPPAAVRDRCGGHPADPILAVAAAVPAVLDPVREYAGDTERGVVHTARDWDQLLELVCDGVGVSVLDT